MNRNPATQAGDADTYTKLDKFDCIIDARSPAEFADDHLPGAINCPVLDDAQRIIVGTMYKQNSPFEARKIGAAMVSENIARHLREHFLAKPHGWRPLVYCWRGGQRSGAMNTVFRQIGWDAKQLEGGYKAFRRFVIEQLEQRPAEFDFRVIKGATGSAKTRILQEMARQGGQVIDLEALACHKGSVLGLIPHTTQPSQKSFETAIFLQLSGFDPARPVFVEAESRKIGSVHIPEQLIEAMRASPGITIEAPREARVAYLLRDYEYFTTDTNILLSRLEPLKQIRGEPTLAKWRALATERQWEAFVHALLAEHYDPLYKKSQDANYRDQGTTSYQINTDHLDPPSIARIASQTLAMAAGIPQTKQALPVHIESHDKG